MPRRERQDKRGGGVAIHCRTDRRIKEIRLDGNQYECLWDKLATSNREYHIASVYHPPTFEYSVTDFIDFLANFCESILLVTPNARIVIAGDVNQLVVKCLIEQSGFLQLVKSPLNMLKKAS